MMASFVRVTRGRMLRLDTELKLSKVAIIKRTTMKKSFSIFYPKRDNVIKHIQLIFAKKQ